MSTNSSILNPLTTAAKENDVAALYKSIQEDPNILNKIDDIPFVDTPLHVAASTDNTLFAVETMAIMPSFCTKLNGEGLTPLHVALQNGRLETARHMVKLDGGLIRVAGRRKMTPMHYLVSLSSDDDVEKLELLIDFLKVCPECVKDVTVDCKTPMHVAIESKSFEAFGVMFGWLWRTGNTNLLDMEDINGITALHLAAQHSNEFPKSVKRPIIRKAFINSEKKTKTVLNRRKFFLSSETAMQKLIRYSANIHKGMSMDIRNVVLVVAVLVATAVYQATLTPPNGVTQGIAAISTSSESTRLLVSPKKVHKHFVLFVSMNTLAFNLALGVMLFVLPFVLYSVFLHLALYFMSVSFLILLDVIGGGEHRTAAKVLMYISLGLFGFAYCARFFIASLKTILWMPWWMGLPYRVLQKVIRCLGMQDCFQELHLQIETVGWSGDSPDSYYR